MPGIVQIDSIRKFEQYPSYLILYELEDDLAASQHIPLHPLSKWKYNFGKLVYKSVANFVLKKSTPPGYIFSIMMTPDYHRLYLNKSNVIPYIIDYWKRYDELFEKHFVHFPVVYISGLEVYEYLKSKRTRVHIKHLPLSISDRHLSIFEKEVPKDIDIINVGRKNKVMDEFIQQYLQKYPATNYVHREMENGENIYYSSRDGRLGKLESRTELLQTLARAKVAIVTSPGLDGGEARTGGFNPVTPRIFEAAIGKCHMVGKYEKNAEFYQFGLDKLVDMPDSFNAFEYTINEKLQIPFDKKEAYAAFLQSNLNSRRIEQLMQEIH